MTQPDTEQTTPTNLPPRKKRRLWLTVLMALLIFGAGAAVGVAGTVLVALKRLEHTLHHPEVVPERLTARLKRRLDLTPGQAEQVKKIIVERQAALQEIRRTAYPLVSLELEKARDQISEVLNDDQRAAWEAWFEEARRRFHPPPPVGTNAGKNRSDGES
jgi:hypothetical protein